MAALVKKIFDYILENKSWIFSGVGLVILGIIFKALSLIRKTRPQPSPQVKYGEEPSSTAKAINSGQTTNVNVQIDKETPESSSVPILVEKLFDKKRRTAPKTYDSDLPPANDIWVGRQSELEIIKQPGMGVVVISGIGGQGKSALAARVLSDIRNQKPEIFWNWRDCKEQSNQFRTQLISAIVQMSDGSIDGEYFTGADLNWISKFFFKNLRELEGVLIFDNVDSYVNEMNAEFVSSVSSFVNEALRVEHNFLIIFTCRPSINYPSTRFRQISLKGLSQDEAIELFNKRIPGGVKKDQEITIKKIHTLTHGHPFWLNVIAVQIGRRQQSSEVIVRNLESNQQMDDQSKAMLRAIWSALNPGQQSVLRCMAELSKSATKNTIFEYMEKKIKTFNKFGQAFRALKANSLIIEKLGESIDLHKYELHPIVKSFVRTEYAENSSHDQVLDDIISVIETIVFRSTGKRLTVDIIEKVITKAELEIRRGNLGGAIQSLMNASDSLIRYGIQEEFVRIGMEIIEKTEIGVSPWSEDSKFDSFFVCLAKLMAQFGTVSELRPHIDHYTSLTNNATARYICLCDLNAYIEWMGKNYEEALKWGKLGVSLKKKSGIDTQHDAAHNFALAQRDSGNIDEALVYFCSGIGLSLILSEDYRKNKRQAHFYGNIGRCLALMQKQDEALKLFSIAFGILENESDPTDRLNLGYAAMWVGDSLEQIKENVSAARFFRYAELVWLKRAPFLAKDLAVKLVAHSNVLGNDIIAQSEPKLREWCKEWAEEKASGS